MSWIGRVSAHPSPKAHARGQLVVSEQNHARFLHSRAKILSFFLDLFASRPLRLACSALPCPTLETKNPTRPSCLLGLFLACCQSFTDPRQQAFQPCLGLLLLLLPSTSMAVQRRSPLPIILSCISSCLAHPPSLSSSTNKPGF